MKRITAQNIAIRAVICLNILLPMVLFNTAYGAEPKLYTAYNLWPGGGYRFEFINFKSSKEFIPAGTEVKSLYRPRETTGFTGNLEDPLALAFTRVDNKKEYLMNFEARYHAGKTPEDYKNLTFTTKNLSELTMGFTECELSAISQGKVVDGMKREAVIVSYGYPPEHVTSSMTDKAWTYYLKRTRKQIIKFDDEGYTIGTGGDFTCKQMVTDTTSTSPTNAQPKTTNYIMERVNVLNELKTQGIISPEEYEAKRKELLSQL